MSGGPIARSWSVYDFILLWLAGQVGAALLIALGVAVGADSIIVFSLAGLYLGFAIVFWLLSRRRDVAELRLSVEPSDLVYIGLGLALQIGLAIAMLPLINLLFPEGRPPQELATVIAQADTPLLQLTLVAATVVIGPAVEELTYRGVLLRALEGRGKTLAIVVSSVVFAAIHITGLDAATIWRSALVVLPPLFVLGAVAAWLTLRTGRLGPAIFLHSGWNLLSAFVLLIPIEVLEELG